MDRTREFVVGLAALGAGLAVFIVVVLLSPLPLVAGVAGGVVGAVSVVVAVLLTWTSQRTQPSETALQRNTLIQALAELIPQMPPGLAWQGTNALTAVGVREVVPDGMRVNPRDHHVVGTEITTDMTAVDLVARTVKPGYTDGDRVVVAPKVVVYAEKKP